MIVSCIQLGTISGPAIVTNYAPTVGLPMLIGLGGFLVILVPLLVRLYLVMVEKDDVQESNTPDDKKEQIVNSNTIELFKNKITFENFNFKDEIYLGIRPEDISIKNDREIKLDVKIDLIENLGFEKIIYAKLSENQIIIKSSEDLSNKPLTISFSKDKVLFFDRNRNRIR